MNRTIVQLGFTFVLSSCALLRGHEAEGAYDAELTACTAAAKAHHPHDNVAGRAESVACERRVDEKWGI